MEQVKRRNSPEWARIISEQKISGLSAKEFCARESIGLASFYQWRKRLNGAPSSTPKSEAKESFIEVKPVDAPDEKPEVGSPCQISLELGDGILLSIWRG